MHKAKNDKLIAVNDLFVVVLFSFYFTTCVHQYDVSTSCSYGPWRPHPYW